MALADKQIENIKNLAIKAHREGKSLFTAKVTPKDAKADEAREEAIFRQMQKLGGEIRLRAASEARHQEFTRSIRNPNATHR